MTCPTYHKELIDGREVEKPLPKKLHAFAETFSTRRFGDEAAAALPSPAGIERPLRRRPAGPRHCDHGRSARYEDGDLADPPTLAVEIMSPGQALSDLVDRCERLHNAGAPQCWIIWPETRQAWTFTPVSLEAAKEKLIASLGETSIEIDLAEIWAELD
jgi:Uma2 family endonuclease